MQGDKLKMIFEKISQTGNLTDTKFIQSTCNWQKIKHVDSAYLIQAISLILVKAYTLSGFKGVINNEVKKDILKMITSRYKNLTLEEINKAFEIDRHSAEPIEHFQLFNSTYVAKVLENYKHWVSDVKTKNPSIKAIEPPRMKTAEELEKIENDFHMLVYQEIKDQGFCHQAWLLYDQIECETKYNDEEKKRMYNYELAKEKKNRIAKGIREKLEGSEFIKNRCKALIVCNHLKRHLESFEHFKKQIITK